MLIGFEAYENLSLSRAKRWVAAYKWPIYFFVAVAFWNLVGAGLFGFLINPPIALYYMQGLNTTPVHAHTALFGVYGMLGIGLTLFCLKGLTLHRQWKTGSLKFAFWSINIGLALMVLISVLPVGLLQTVASVEHGMWYARSAEFLQGEAQCPSVSSVVDHHARHDLRYRSQTDFLSHAFIKEQTMTLLNVQTTVGDLVKDRPARSRIFEELKIDYCCGGKLPLAEVCAKKGLDPEQVLRQIRDADARDDRFVDADAMGLGDLADHIEVTHHGYLRQELPRLDAMTHKVASVHGDKEARLIRIRQVFEAFHAEIASHMMKEEQILFPMIRELEVSETLPAFHCGSLANPIAQMEHEHDAAGDALAEFRELTDDFTPPAWACNTFRAMFDALHELEQNMHQYVHKENNVLFPKALRLEAERGAVQHA